MKKLYVLLLSILLSFSFLHATYVGKFFFKSQDGKPGSPFFTTQSRHIGLFFDEQIKIGNLRLTKIQNDPMAEMEHHRYSQRYKGLEVFGGQIIKHYKKNELVGINGEYYRIHDVDTIPVLSKDEAVEIFRSDLNEEDLSEMSEKSKLLIYPVSDGDYRLAFQIVLEKGPGYCMTGIVDARNGKIHLKYSNVYFNEPKIGLGIGYHGKQYKLATTLVDNDYYLYDEQKTRPVFLATYDFGTYDGDYYYIASDSDNFWDHDGAMINLHAYVGLTYDYYYLFHDRHGIDNSNMDIKATIHWYDGRDNAFWDGNKKHLYFLDPGKRNIQMAASIDLVAHEYSHGVTQYSSNLNYLFESGALHESFSDIMGTAVEHYWQPKGSGSNKSDWVIGEDVYPSYKSNKYLRSLSDPNSHWQSSLGPDPCHLAQQIFVLLSVDNGGVHLNSTIYSHAFYLLAEGGTNRVSRKKVTGIGIKKANKIFYRAWVYYLTETSNFWVAASALVQSAYDLYGSNSQELQQTIRSMEAIGWVYE